MRYESTGNLLWARRKLMGLNQREAAERLGFTSQFWGRIEKGTVGIPKDAIKTACEVLEIKPLVFASHFLADFHEDLKRYL